MIIALTLHQWLVRVMHLALLHHRLHDEEEFFQSFVHKELSVDD